MPNKNNFSNFWNCCKFGVKRLALLWCLVISAGRPNRYRLSTWLDVMICLGILLLSLTQSINAPFFCSFKYPGRRYDKLFCLTTNNRRAGFADKELTLNSLPLTFMGTVSHYCTHPSFSSRNFPYVNKSFLFPLPLPVTSVSQPKVFTQKTYVFLCFKTTHRCHFCSRSLKPLWDMLTCLHSICLRMSLCTSVFYYYVFSFLCWLVVSFIPFHGRVMDFPFVNGFCRQGFFFLRLSSARFF